MGSGRLPGTDHAFHVENSIVPNSLSGPPTDYFTELRIDRISRLLCQHHQDKWSVFDAACFAVKFMWCAIRHVCITNTIYYRQVLTRAMGLVSLHFKFAKREALKSSNPN